MTDNTNSLKFGHFLFLWFGAAISVAEILAGGLLAPLGFYNGLAAIILGHLIGVTLLVLGGIIGYRQRIPAIESTRISFGVYGSRLFSVLNVMQLVGWTAIMIISAAKSANEISRMMWHFDNIISWNIVVGGLILLWIALGRDQGWKKINMAAVLLLFALTAVLSVAVFKDAGALSQPPSGSLSFSQGLELSVIMPLSWLPLIADYTRFAKSGKGAAGGSWLGYFIGSCWMYIIGLGIAITADNVDPSAVMLAANLGIPALGIIVLATVTTTFMDAYSAGVSCGNVYHGINEKCAAIAITVIGTLIALSINIEQYESFLLAIGSVFAPLFAVLLSDYFILKNRRIQPGLMANWGALAVWAIGVALYYQFLKLELIMGATIPVMAVTGIVYTFIGRYAKRWSYNKKSPDHLYR